MQAIHMISMRIDEPKSGNIELGVFTKKICFRLNVFPYIFNTFLVARMAFMSQFFVVRI